MNLVTQLKIFVCGFGMNNEFLISNFHHVLNVLCFLLGNSLVSEFYMPTFHNTLFRLHGQVGVNNELGLRIVMVYVWEKMFDSKIA